MLKKVLRAIGAIVLLVFVVVGGFVGSQVVAFNQSMEKVYDVPVPTLTHSTDPAVLARGEHLARSIAACATRDCHGSDMGGGRTLDLGPLGTFSGPNVTLLRVAYSDGEMARLIRHGIKRDGRSLRFMPAHEISWLPDNDVLAVVSWLRSIPASQRPSGEMRLGVLGKILDRRGMMIIDVARHIDHSSTDRAPAPSPDVAYGRYLGRLCTGCHGEHLSGGPIPGAPSSMAVPLNITPDATGIREWSYEDFERMITNGTSKNGRRLDPLMPLEILQNMDQTERRALFSYLRSLPARPFGGR